MLVLLDGKNITGEGMGIGAIALKGPRFFCFSRTCTAKVLSPGVIEKTFFIDCRLLWGRANSPSVPVTLLLQGIADWYMRLPVLQPFLRFSSPVRSRLGLRTFFEPIPPVAEARFTYRFNRDKVEVSCSVRPLGEHFTSAVILNELAADTFTHAFSGGEATPPPSGWLQFEPGCELYDPVRQIRFGISYTADGRSVPGKLFWGREYTGELRWAGFGIEIPGNEASDEPLSCSYEVRFTMAPPQEDPGIRDASRGSESGGTQDA
jgi:hypothetical protein